MEGYRDTVRIEHYVVFDIFVSVFPELQKL